MLSPAAPETSERQVLTRCDDRSTEAAGHEDQRLEANPQTLSLAEQIRRQFVGRLVSSLSGGSRVGRVIDARLPDGSAHFCDVIFSVEFGGGPHRSTSRYPLSDVKFVD